MRRVHPAETVAHLWANRAQDDARNPHGNFFFNGPALYSYGSHYVVAYHMPEQYGRVILANSRSYSNTTSKHQTLAARAYRGHGRVINVPGINSSDIAALERCGCARIIATLESAARSALADAIKPRIRAATVEAHLRIAARLIDDARELAKLDAARKELDKDSRKASARIVKHWPADVAGMTREEAQELARKINTDEFRKRAEGYAARAESGAKRAAEYSDALARANVYRDARSLYESAAEQFNNAGEKAKARAALKRAKECAESMRLADIKHEAQEKAKALEIAQRMADAPTLRECCDMAPHYAKPRWHADGSLRDGSQMLQHFGVIFKLARDAMGESVAMKLEARRDELNELENARYLYAARGSILESIDTMRNHSRTASTRAEIIATSQGWARVVREIERVCERYSNPESIAGILPTIAEEVKQAKERAEAAEAGRADEWRAGGRDSFELPCGSAALRIMGDAIQTSRGASVPLSVAPFVWRAVNECRANNTPHEFGNDAPALGSFRLTRIDAAGSITVGCHFISFDELRRIARALGYANA